MEQVQCYFLLQFMFGEDSRTRGDLIIGLWLGLLQRILTPIYTFSYRGSVDNHKYLQHYVNAEDYEEVLTSNKTLKDLNITYNHLAKNKTLFE